MKRRVPAILGLIAFAIVLSGSTCVVEEASYDEGPYGEESAEEQTMDEQMREVEEQIDR